MAIPDALRKKMQAQGTAPPTPEDESPSDLEEGSESASDIDAPIMKGAKPNPLKMWADKKLEG